MTSFNSPFLPTAPNVWAGSDKRIVASGGSYRVWEQNFLAYHTMGVYQVEVSSL